MPAPSASLEEDPRGLFGPIYTYDEWQVAHEVEKQKKLDEKEARTAGILDSMGKKPAHWPDDTEPDTGKWCFWLPEGWGQGVKPTAGGKTLKCFVGPPGSDPSGNGKGRRIFHKPEVEKHVGYPLKTKEDTPTEAKEKTTKSCHDTLPTYPDFLPHDWCIAYRQLPTGLHRIYLPPGQREGFLWHRACVEEWIGGNPKKMAIIENSKKMEDIMVHGYDKSDEARKLRKLKKRKHGETAHVRPEVTDQSYAKCPRLAACKVNDLEDAGCPAEARANLIKQEEVVRELLVKRGFSDVDFMAFFLTALEEGKEDNDDDEGTRPYGEIVERCPGLFYKMTEVNGRPCYHQIRTSEGAFACTGLYLYWCPGRKAWKLSCKVDDETAAGYAVFSCEEADQSTKLLPGDGRSWNVLPKNVFAQPEEEAAQPAAGA